VRVEHLMDPLFVWLEAMPLSTVLRDSPSLWAFPFVLILHTVGLAFFVGANVAWDLRVLGFSPGIPLDALRRYFLVMWAGLWVNAFSGVLLLIAYPTKALTNPLFYVKLGLIAVVVAHASWVRRQSVGTPAFDVARLPTIARVTSAAALVCWAAAITAGRLLAYTYHYLMAYEPR
jgi:hypothetical protein